MKFKIFNKEFDYKWIIAGTLFVMMFMTLGFCSSNRGVYLTAITEALNMPRASFSASYSLRFITSMTLSLFFGYFIAHLGAKRLALIGIASLTASCLLYATGTNVIVFGIAAILLGLGISFTGNTIAGYIVREWFSEKKGTFMGIIMAANGVGGAVALQIMGPIIDLDNTQSFGYRKAYFIIAALMVIVGILILIFLKDKPKEESKIQEMVAEKAKKKDYGTPLSELVRQKRFYGAIIPIFISGFILTGISEVSSPLFHDVGFSAEYITLLGTIASLSLTIAKMSMGVISDKFGTKCSMYICFTAAILAMLALPIIDNTAFGKALAIVKSFLGQMAMPLETIMLPLLTMAMFDKRDFAKMLCILNAASRAGISLAGPLFNLCFDKLGSYNLAIYISCALMAGAFIVMVIALNKQKDSTDEKTA